MNKLYVISGNLRTFFHCFDLDNTLVSYPKINSDYTSVEPIQKNIDLLKYLKRLKIHLISYIKN